MIGLLQVAAVELRRFIAHRIGTHIAECDQRCVRFPGDFYGGRP